MWLGPKVGGALQAHGGIHKHFSDARQAVGKAAFEKEVDRVGEGGILVWLGHGWCLVDYAPPFFQPWPGTSISQGASGIFTEAMLHQLVDAIRESDLVIVMCSRAAVRSPNFAARERHPRL